MITRYAKFMKCCDETGWTWVRSMVWMTPIIGVMLSDDLSRSELAWLFASLFGGGITFGIIGKSIFDWVKRNSVLILLLWIASQASASPMVDDGLAIAESRTSPTIQTTGMGPVGVVVVVVGGVTFYYWVVRPCIRWLNSTNAIKARNKALEEASQNYYHGTCLADLPAGNLIRLSFANGVLTASSPFAIPAQYPPYGQTFTLNGEEIQADTSSIQFDLDTVRIQPADFRYVVERSSDLINWEPVLTMEQPSEGWELEDTFVDPQQFYRVR